MFLELFAGHAGFSKAVKDVAGDVAEVMEPLDGYYNWDIFVDADFEKAKEAVKRADHTHLAFMCKSFTLARRTDSHGAVDIISGAGQQARGKGGGLASYHPGGGGLLTGTSVGFVCLGPSGSSEDPQSGRGTPQPVCIYGAESVKPTAILNARWILTVKRMCKDVAPHYHLKRGLTGKVFDPNVTKVLDAMVLTPTSETNHARSASAQLQQRPAGYSAARGCSPYLLAEDQQVQQHPRAARPVHERRGNADTSSSPRIQGTKAERRQRENAVAIGGLRDPRRAVARSCTLRQTGAKIRNVINEFLSDELIASFDNANGACPFSSELLTAARQKLARVFGAEPNAENYQTNLFKQILFEADDPDRNTFRMGLSLASLLA